VGSTDCAHAVEESIPIANIISAKIGLIRSDDLLTITAVSSVPRSYSRETHLVRKFIGVGALCRFAPRRQPQFPICGYLAVPVNVADCVPAASVTDTVAVLVPAASAVRGLNCTVTRQLALGASVVKPALPQVVPIATIE